MLVRLAGATPGSADAAQALAACGVDWSELLRLARAHDVYPLLARHLAGFAGVPEPVRAQLEEVCRFNAVRARLFEQEQARILGELATAGVPAIPLKGVALARRIHGNITARPCSDIDILVPREEIARAAGLLLEAGYEPDDVGRESLSDPGLLVDSDIEIALRRHRPGVPFLVELHWDIAWRWQSDTGAVDDLWAEARRTGLRACDAWAMSPEWECLYLAVHAAHHRWRSLKWLVDIHHLLAIEYAGLDLGRLHAKARRFGWERLLRLTLGACHALFGTRIPESLARPLPGWVLAQLHRPVGPWDEALFAARLFEPGGRLQYLLRLVAVPTVRERRLVPLPERLASLYYVIRPVRLGARSAVLVSRAFGRRARAAFR
jgi:hypothetical protein